MARRWLEVITDEVQARRGANDRLAERRRQMAAAAWAAIDGWVGEAFQQAGERIGNREYRVAGDRGWTVASCGIYAPGAVEHDPRVAFHEAAFDAYRPLLILRRKADGANTPVKSQTLRVARLNRDSLSTFLGA